MIIVQARGRGHTLKFPFVLAFPAQLLNYIHTQECLKDLCSVHSLIEKGCRSFSLVMSPGKHSHLCWCGCVLGCAVSSPALRYESRRAGWGSAPFLATHLQPSRLMKAPALKSVHLNVYHFILVLQDYIDLALRQTPVTELLFDVGPQ